MNKTIIIKVALGLIIGAGLGYAYYHFFGCNGGCPLSSNWFTTVAFGAFFGAVMMYPSKPKKDSE